MIEISIKRLERGKVSKFFFRKEVANQLFYYELIIIVTIAE
jgi:hypothetical protein